MGDWVRAAYAWVVSWMVTSTAHRGVLLAALIFLTAVSVANAARGDWLSVAVGLIVAVACARRLASLRRRAEL